MAARKFEFVGSCVDLDGDLIDWIRGRQRDIGGPKPNDLDFDDFSDLVPASQFQHEGLDDDWHVRFYVSSAPSGMPLVYYAHSGIEWVFAPRGSGFDPDMEAELVAAKLDAEYATPNRGKPTTDSAAFRRWFGDSKVVDEDGEPLVVYHGTSAEFSVFDAERTGESTDAGTLGAGFYFTTSLEVAQNYADAAAEKHGGYARVLRVYLRIRRPYVAPRRIWQISNEPKAAKRHSASLKRQGYDGVFFHIDQSVLNAPSFDEFVVFDPRQIKSATDNEGTFDPKSPDVRKNPERTFTPPVAVAKRAQYGQYLRAQMPPSKQCCVETGLRRGEQLATRSPVSVHDMVVMRAWFARHEVDKRGKGWEFGSEGYPSKGRQAWELWGGDEAREWVETTLAKLGE